jgi:hypothetical protein
MNMSKKTVEWLLSDSFLRIREFSGGRGFYTEFQKGAVKGFKVSLIRPVQQDYEKKISAKECAAINELSDICHNLPRFLAGDEGVAFMLPQLIEQAKILYEKMQWQFQG